MTNGKRLIMFTAALAVASAASAGNVTANAVWFGPPGQPMEARASFAFEDASGQNTDITFSPAWKAMTETPLGNGQSRYEADFTQPPPGWYDSGNPDHTLTVTTQVRNKDEQPGGL